MEIEGVEGQQQGEKEKVNSTFIKDMGLDEEQEMEPVDCSFEDPDYQEPWDAHLMSSSSEDECRDEHL